jgi:hypothetical protein
MSDAGSIGSSFRDPHGFVFRVDDVIYRQVSNKHRDHHDLLLSSGLYETLASEDLLISHEEASIELARGPDAYRILRPVQIPFVSYPYEWGFSQLQDAARVTLRIQELALDHGMSLRDATSFNITFHRGRPIFIDTTSFERVRPGQPWVWTWRHASFRHACVVDRRFSCTSGCIAGVNGSTSARAAVQRRHLAGLSR